MQFSELFFLIFPFPPKNDPPYTDFICSRHTSVFGSQELICVPNFNLIGLIDSEIIDCKRRTDRHTSDPIRVPFLYSDVRNPKNLGKPRTKSMVANDDFIRNIQMELINGFIDVGFALEKLR